MLKSMVKRSIRNMGFDIERHNVVHSADARFAAMLAANRINLIFDIGANLGQFARSVRESGYSGRIVSFEPLSSAWTRLAEACEKDPLWDVAPRCAIGSEDGEITMHIAGNLASSSALNMLDSHVAAAPDSAYVGTEIAPVHRLDTIAGDYLETDSRLLIKIDTQGFEDQVLKGAPELINKAVGLHMELLVAPLYEHQCRYDEMLDRVRALGYELWDINSVFVDPETGRTLAADTTFFR